MSQPSSDSGLEIAVIGMAGRFPGARTVGELWENLVAGVESIGRFTEEEVTAAGVAPALSRDPAYVRAGGVLEDIELFDAAFFGYSPRDAARMDPQQRVFLETAWSALEDAGYDSHQYGGAIGVYAGVSRNDYLLRNLVEPGGEPLDYSTTLGNDKDFLATRVSYKLDLNGPSVVVQSGCSTSLVAIHLACQALLGAECDMALAGGATVRLPQRAGYLYQEDGAYSPDGHCRAFDADARGSVPGNGVAAVVLKRLADAIADGDTIHAVVKGSAVNNDGGEKIGYTAPSPDGQASVIRQALEAADVPAESIGYVEAHGTGTILGDPIEVEALTRAFREQTSAKGYCAIGSVKTNLGHLDVTAGVTGFIKAVLSVKHGVVAPSLHFRTPNPRIDFPSSPFYVNARLRDWSRRQCPRRAGVSAFGIGGTNAHVVIEQPPTSATTRVAGPRRPHFIVLSARSSEALDASRRELARHLERRPELAIEDVAFTLQRGRRALPWRAGFVARDLDEVKTALGGERAAGIAASEGARVAFLFPGQGAQFAGMTRSVYDRVAEFRAQVDRASDILMTPLGLDLRELLYPEPRDRAEADDRLRDTRLAQPAIFVVSHALARTWLYLGVEPSALLGHSVGEFVAACLSGVFSLEDALRLIAERGALMSELPPGGMLAVPLCERDLEHHLDDGIELAALNAPNMSVVAGPADAIDALAERLSSSGITFRRLQTSHAFHSAMMEPAVEPFRRVVEQVELAAPRIPYLSNVTGRWITNAEATDPSYWARHLRRTVRFSDALGQLIDAGHVLLEVGPGRALTSLARRQGNARRAPVAIASTAQANRSGDDDAFEEAAVRLWSAGIAVDWARLHGRRGRRIPLPTYPFERKRYWVEPRADAMTARDDGGADKPSDLSKWLWAPSWKRLVAESKRGARRDRRDNWVVLTDEVGLGSELVELLEADGEDVVTVAIGDAFSRHGDRRFRIDPRRAEDYATLARALAPAEALHLVHCFGVELDDDDGAELEMRHRERGFDSVFLLVRALSEITTSCRLSVVTSQVHDVIGNERLFPTKALVLGACRTIPLEYPGFECLHVDVGSPTGGNERRTMAALLRDTLVSPPPSPRVTSVAIRGRHRWLQTYVPLDATPSSSMPAALKKRGVYLITGGLGGIGLALAEHLARDFEARLVLTGRSPFPPRASWPAPVREAPLVDVEQEAERLTAAEGALVKKLGVVPMSRCEGLSAALDRLSAAYLLRLIREAGIETGPERRWDRDSLRRALGIVPSFRGFFDMTLRVLSEDGYLSADGDAFRFAVPPRQWPDSEKLSADAKRAFPSFEPVLSLLHHCGSNLGPALRGERPALSILFDEDGAALFKRGADNVLEHSMLRVHQELVRELVASIVRTNAGSRLRVLEVGGGEGRLTEVVLSELRGHDVDYCFTDLGKSFTVGARNRAHERGDTFMRFRVLDISRPPTDQGFDLESFDLVLAFNVVHATRDVCESLCNLNGLLAPGGAIALLESTEPQRWVDLVWGLTDGWWAFGSDARRDQSPLLGLEEWRAALEASGFESVASVPPKTGEAASDSALILACKPAAAAALGAAPSVEAKARKLRELEQLGAEIEVVQADTCSIEDMRRAVERADARFGALDGVIHAALILDDGAMQLKTRARIDQVLAPKVRGTQVLREVVADRDLDFFVMFSSLVAVTGGAGQVDYCAASNFQDAFAHAERSLARSVLSVDWGAWREVGKALREALARGAAPESVLPGGMSTKEGIEVFMRVLDVATPQVLVSPTPLPQLLVTPQRGQTKEPTIGGPDPHGSDDGRGHPPPAIPSGAAALNETERIIAEIWKELLGVDAVGAHDNFFDLGGDSVVSIQFIAKARKAGLRFTNRQVFEHQTVAKLAASAAGALEE